MLSWLLQSILSAIIGTAIPILYHKYKVGINANKQHNLATNSQKALVRFKHKDIQYFYLMFVYGLTFYSAGIAISIIRPLEMYAHTNIVDFVMNVNGITDSILSFIFFTFSFMGFSGMFLWVHFPNIIENEISTKDTTDTSDDYKA